MNLAPDALASADFADAGAGGGIGMGSALAFLVVGLTESALRFEPLVFVFGGIAMGSQKLDTEQVKKNTKQGATIGQD